MLRKRMLLFPIFVICFLVITIKATSSPVSIESCNCFEQMQNSSFQTTKPLPADISRIRVNLDKAKAEGKPVFVVVTGNGIANTGKASTLAKNALTLLKNAVVIQLNRDDTANSQLVAEWRLAGAPLPLILVLSSKGIPVGGFQLADATAEKLAALVPTPKMEELLVALNNKKPVFVILAKKSFKDRDEVMKECKEAVKILKNNASIVEVDLDDKLEQTFIERLEVDKQSPETTTQVVNIQGQVVGTSSGLPDAAKLAEAAVAAPKSGCCPGGAGSAGCPK